MRDEEILMLFGLGLLALSSVKKVEAKKEEAKKVEKYMTYTAEGVPAPAGVGGAEAPEELARKIQESPHVKQAIENIAISPIEEMLIVSPDQPIQIVQPKPPEEVTISPIEKMLIFEPEQPIQIVQPKPPEEVTISPIEKMLIFEPEQPIQPAVKEESPIQIQPITLSEEMTSSTEKVQPKIPCNLRGSGYPWDWVDCGVSGYMNCLDQILGAFPDSRLACGVLVYLYKNNLINNYCCRRYCVNCNGICFGWASQLLSGNKISGYCDQGNCYIEGGIQVYPFDKEYVLSTGDQVLIANLRQLGCL